MSIVVVCPSENTTLALLPGPQFLHQPCGGLGRSRRQGKDVCNISPFDLTRCLPRFAIGGSGRVYDTLYSGDSDVIQFFEIFLQSAAVADVVGSGFCPIRRHSLTDGELVNARLFGQRFYRFVAGDISVVL